jgi:hypothetical protein
VRLQLQAKNITDPDIETVYRSEFIGGDTTKTSYSKGASTRSDSPSFPRARP